MWRMKEGASSPPSSSSSSLLLHWSWWSWSFSSYIVNIKTAAASASIDLQIEESKDMPWEIQCEFDWLFFVLLFFAKRTISGSLQQKGTEGQHWTRSHSWSLSMKTDHLNHQYHLKNKLLKSVWETVRHFFFFFWRSLQIFVRFSVIFVPITLTLAFLPVTAFTKAKEFNKLWYSQVVNCKATAEVPEALVLFYDQKKKLGHQTSVNHLIHHTR